MDFPRPTPELIQQTQRKDWKHSSWAKWLTRQLQLTRRGAPTVRLVPIATESIKERRARVMQEVMEAARLRGPDGGPSAARSADFLYDENGLPA